MPVKRRLHKGRKHRITEDAIEAYKAVDRLALHRALQLRPWQASPLEVDPDCQPADEGTAWAASWQLAVDLQRELEACR